jgi:hypothetical protein
MVFIEVLSWRFYTRFRIRFRRITRIASPEGCQGFFLLIRYYIGVVFGVVFGTTGLCNALKCGTSGNLDSQGVLPQVGCRFL